MVKTPPRKHARSSTSSNNEKPGSIDWQERVLSQIRRLIKEADPGAIEEVKWRKPSNPDGVPVWSDHGIICTGEWHKNHVRVTFAKGASLKDPNRVFNSGFDGHTFRAIVIHEGDEIDESGFKSLIRSAAELNASSAGN